MKLYIKGTPNEINEFLYGDSRELNKIAEEDNPNIPIGDDDTDKQIAEVVQHLGNLLVEKFS